MAENYLPHGRMIKTYTRIPDYLRRGFDTAVEFTKGNACDGGYKGLLLLFGREAKLKRALNKLNGSLTHKYEKYNPILFSEILLDLYHEMGDRDGGIAFDLDGNLLGTEVLVERVCDRGLKETMAEVMRRKGNGHESAERHRAGCYASKRGVPSVVVSEEMGTVITFRGGGILQELFYDPLSDHEMTGIKNKEV